MKKHFKYLVFILLFAVLAPSVAQAESRKVLAYPLASVYASAIRLLRVDLDFEILEKDKEGGYIIFNYRDTMGKKYRGSLELINKNNEKENITQAVCNVPDVPSYMEKDLLEKLNSKLAADNR